MIDPVTTENLLVIAVGTLSGIVGLFWRQHQASIKELKEQASNCEKDREQLWKDREALWKGKEQLVIRLEALEKDHEQLRTRYDDLRRRHN